MRVKGSLLAMLLMCWGSNSIASGQEAERQILGQRFAHQPLDFSNKVFEREGQTIVRSSKFTQDSEVFGDFDGDNDVDQYDYYVMQICWSFSGPAIPTPPACFVFDSDMDGDIDLSDAVAFQAAYTGTLSKVRVEAGQLVPVQASGNGYYSGEPGTWGNNALNGIARQAGYSQDDLWYEWTLEQNPLGSGEVILANASQPSTAFTILPPLSAGSYVFLLRVTNLITFEFNTDWTSLAVVDDADGDGVLDPFDVCPNTPIYEPVDSNGCSNSQRDSDGDGVTDDLDQCPDTPATSVVDQFGCPLGGGPVCGNGSVESGEQCDDGNVVSGDGCSSTCQTESNPGIANDNCATPTAIGESSLVFSNVGSTTDGPDEPIDCSFFGRGDIRSDLWYCYTATCTGQSTISLCGSGYDTKMAVYSECRCPDSDVEVDRPIACSDDDCGSGVDNTQSRVTINATAGQSYMVRVGGYFGNREQGEGRLTIRCGQDTCTNGTGSCTEGHEDGQPGCDTETCCNRVCEVDTFCCDVTWDSFCASQAGGFCSGMGFSTCSAEAGACDADQPSPGCNNAECCNAVCQSDPYCCITSWDSNCVSQSDLICASCGRGRGDCNVARTDPGCSDIDCCGKVCGQDEFCCNTEWDAQCVAQAADLCGR